MSSKKIVNLQKKVREKINSIHEQKNILTAMVDSFVSEADEQAERLLAEKNESKFMQHYLDVMKFLDQSYNSCVMLTAEAEETLDVTDLLPQAVPVDSSDDEETSLKGATATPKCKSLHKSVSPPVKDSIQSISTEYKQSKLTSTSKSNDIESYIDFERKNDHIENLTQNYTKPSTNKSVMNLGVESVEIFKPDVYVDPSSKKEDYSNVTLVLEEQKRSNILSEQHDSTTASLTTASDETILSETPIVVDSKHHKSKSSSKTGKPRIDTDAAARFLKTIIRQAEKDNSSLNSSPNQSVNQKRKESLKVNAVGVPKTVSSTVEDVSILSTKKENNKKTEKEEEKLSASVIESSPEKPTIDSSKTTEKTNYSKTKEENTESTQNDLTVLKTNSKNDNSMKKTVPLEMNITSDNYKLICHIGHMTLPIGRPIPAVVSETCSPWNFYVQVDNGALDRMMQEIKVYMETTGKSVGGVDQAECGKVYLAQFSQDQLYYRAKVTDISNSAEFNVLYIDYGNTEKRDITHLRQLPAVFAVLPAQAIYCALAKISPSNKYGVWSEQDILTFSHLTHNKKFFCTLIQLSQHPEIPNIVDLFFNSTLPGTWVQTPVFVQTILMNNNIGRMVTIQEQVNTFMIFFQLSPTKPNSSPPPSSQASGGKDLEKHQHLNIKSSQSDTKDNSLLTQKSSATKSNSSTSPPSQGTVGEDLTGHHMLNKTSSKSNTTAVQKSPQLKSNSSLSPSFNKTSDIERHHHLNKKSIQSDAKDNLIVRQKFSDFNDEDSLTADKGHNSSLSNEAIGLKTSFSKEDMPIYCDRKTSVVVELEEEKEESPNDRKGHKTGQNKDSVSDGAASKSVIKKEVVVSVDKDTNTSQNIEFNKLDVKEISNNSHNVINELKSETGNSCELVNQKVLDDFHKPGTDNKIDILRITHSETDSHSIRNEVDQNANIRESEDLLNLDNMATCFDVMISFVNSPSKFYVHIISEVTAKTLNVMSNNINTHYSQMSHKQLQKLSKSLTLQVNDVCCAQFTEDNKFYRAQIVEVARSIPPVVKSKGSDSDSKVKVFYMDYGDVEWVAKSRLFPLPKDLQKIPPLAVKCCLAYTTPINAGEDWDGNVKKYFNKLTGDNEDKKLKMILVNGSIEQSLDGIDSDPLQVILVDNTDSEEICINMDLIKQGLADLDMKDKINDTQQSLDITQKMHDWDPMMEDFFSIRNSYQIDVDDAGVATVGYKARDESRICKYYNIGDCWRGERCPYRHVQMTPDGVTQDQELVYGAIDEYYMEKILPDPGTWVAVEVTTILNPGHFYVSLPFGKSAIDNLKEKEESDKKRSEEWQMNFDELISEMQEEYNKVNYNEDNTVDKAPGEIVAAKYSSDGKWYRAKVLIVEESRVRVFFVDFGNREWIRYESIRTILPDFLHLPFQAVECFLMGIEPVGAKYSTESKQRFKNLVDGKILVSFVKTRSYSGIIWIDLYDTTGDEDIDIAKMLSSEKLVQETGSTTTTSSKLSHCSSQNSLVLVPG